MRRGPRTLIALLATLLLLLSSISLAAAQSNTTVVVRPEDVGINGSWNVITANGGSFDLVNGPATPPLGSGSAEFSISSVGEGAVLSNDHFTGTLLSDIQDITYSTYRDSSSSSSPTDYPFIEFDVYYSTNAAATFFWEPSYSYGPGNLQTNTWQTWDAMAASQTANDGGWWSLTDAGNYKTGTYVSWSDLVNDVGPGATIGGVFKVAAGYTGAHPVWDGSFEGNVDALSINIGGDTTTYDFEPYVNPPTTYAQCYFGGWQNFDNPPFSSQAECAQYVAVQQLRQYYCSRFPNLSICQAAVLESSSR